MCRVQEGFGALVTRLLAAGAGQAIAPLEARVARLARRRAGAWQCPASVLFRSSVTTMRTKQVQLDVYSTTSPVVNKHPNPCRYRYSPTEPTDDMHAFLLLGKKEEEFLLAAAAGCWRLLLLLLPIK